MAPQFYRPRTSAGGGGGPTAGYVLWLAADNLVGLSDNDTFSSWPDASGNGNHPTITSTFTYKTGIINGLPVARLSGFHYMELADFSALTEATMLIVFRNSVDGDNIWNLTESSDDPKSYVPFSGGGTYDSFFSTVRKNNFNSGITTQWNVYAVRSASNDWTCDVNGVSKHSTGTNTVSAPSAGRIGASGVSTWSGTNGGDIAEILLYPSALSSGDLGDTTDYLMTKYDL